MNKIKNNYKTILLIVLFIIIFFIYGYYRIFKSYGYVSNIELIRTVVKNTAGFYYDRGGYIQYDSSFMDDGNNVKRSEYFSFIDANRDNIKYIDQVGFVYNVFKMGIDYDISQVIGDISIDNFYNFGKNLYSQVSLDDKRRNVGFNDGEYVIDYYDNQVVTLSGSMGAIEDHHYLMMYVKNSELDDLQRNGIFNKLSDSLYIGDILLFNNKLLLYVGNGMFMYASGEDYDYVNEVDNIEDRAINVIDINDLNNEDSEMYLYNSLEFYVYRLLNISGYWTKLPGSYQVFKNYYGSGLVPNIKIEKFGSKGNNSDVYIDDEIVITIKITNNSNSKVVIPVISDMVDTSKLEYISNNYVDEAYQDGNLIFSDVGIDGNSYREISYKLKVIDSEGVINFNNTKIDNYYINNISYKIGKKIDFTRLINGEDDIFTNYKKLYNITLSEDKLSDENSKIIISNLYGGRKVTNNSGRVRNINRDILMTGDIILYNEEVVMYIKNMDDEYLVNRDNMRMEIDIDSFFRGLFSKNEFVIIRPSYLYDDTFSKFGNLVVDYDNLIIYVSSPCVYSEIIKEFSQDLVVEVRDINDKVISVSESVKTGSKIVVREKEYYISLLGDINGDGLINTGDVLKLHRYVLGKIESLEKYYLASSYINQDDLINTGDVLKLHRYVLGKVNSLE